MEGAFTAAHDIGGSNAVTHGCEDRTDNELEAFAEKVAGRFASPGNPGDEHPQFKRLFDGETAAALLPKSRDDRTKALGELAERIQDAKTPEKVKKDDAPGLVAAIAAEQAALKGVVLAQKDYDDALAKEVEAKIATVVALRSMAGAITQKEAKNPARIRRLLGRATPAKPHRKKKTDGTEQQPPKQRGLVRSSGRARGRVAFSEARRLRRTARLLPAVDACALRSSRSGTRAGRRLL